MPLETPALIEARKNSPDWRGSRCLALLCSGGQMFMRADSAKRRLVK